MNHPNLSQELLNELKGQLEAKEVELKKEIALLDTEDSFEELDRTVGNAEAADEAQEAESHLLTEVKEDTAEDSLGNVEVALAKIEDGTYGICESKEDGAHPIDIERLKALPEAETCLKHANGA